ncbi:hypothetical protein RRG08_053864 [Elysia crispata]|uniref:Uncharacterized protein n=1 Tax=Elysia crispata TaxID=231223 RepID=A0AAE0YLK1_9GAST|nr:hypothetical protein RRG08_053864 [Elysia crispata]
MLTKLYCGLVLLVSFTTANFQFDIRSPPEPPNPMTAKPKKMPGPVMTNGSSNETNSGKGSGKVTNWKYVTLALVTLTKQNSSVAPYICMVPYHWLYFSALLLSGPGKTRVVLRSCSRRLCPKNPDLYSLKFTLRNAKAEVKLNSFPLWDIVPHRAFKFSIISNAELHVTSSRVNATIKRTNPNWYTLSYKMGLTVKASGKYKGILGELASQPVRRLKKLSKKKARRVCQDEGSAFSVLINRKTAWTWSRKNLSRTHKKRKD